MIAATVVVGWQFAACEVANIELQDDLEDLAAQVGTKIGLDAQRTDAELRAMVIRRAEDYDIALTPQQVTVRRSGSGESEVIRLTVDYQARVNLLGYSFILHFTPKSSR